MKILYFIPKNLLSFVVGMLASLRLPGPLNRKLLTWFAGRYKLNLGEAEKSLGEYKSLNALFTRRLKEGVRPIQSDWVHPVDAKLTQAQTINQGQLIQAKGINYSVDAFLGFDANTLKRLKVEDRDLFSKLNSKRFEAGHSLTYYLCPTDYHRTHCPSDATIIAASYLPGRLWPVNPWSVENISQLFAVNERVVIWLETAKGLMAYVMVGATNVGKMTMAFDPQLVTNASHFREAIFRSYTPGIKVKVGEELGVFNMGSTVILLTEKTVFDSIPQEIGVDVKLGQKLV